MTHHFTRIFCLYPAMILGLFLVGGCAQQQTIDYASPTQRNAPVTDFPWKRNHFIVLAYHDVEDSVPDQTFMSVRTDHLQEQFAWLRENDYVPVSVDQLLAARRGETELPKRAVLLTFDDGYRSFYDRVYPLLKAYKWPAVVAPVGIWANAPAGSTVDFGGKLVPRERFLTWHQLGEISRSGLIEIAAHSNDLHRGIHANPQGNRQPAAAARLYNPTTSEYESDHTYQKRINDDVVAISNVIFSATGKKPRVWVWPYGTTSGLAAKVIRDNGYDLLLTLEDGLGDLNTFGHLPRLLISNDPVLHSFSQAVFAQEKPQVMRVAHVRLDDIYDPNPEKMDQKLGLLVQRIADYQITTIFLQAWSDQNKDGQLDALYFPNKLLPMRADLFNRAAWQLRSRAFVDVYASMPIQKINNLAPSERSTLDVFEDLSRYAIFAGIHYEDQTSRSLTEDITQHMRDLRGEELKTAATIKTVGDNPDPLLQAHTLNTLTSSLDRFDWVILQFPVLASRNQETEQKIRKLSQQLNLNKAANQRIVIGLPGADTRKTSTEHSVRLAQWMHQLQTQGFLNFDYVHDDFINDIPQMSIVRPIFSNAWYPLK